MLKRYYKWLHGGVPAGEVEKLPVVREHGLTNVSGVRVVGDLSGTPLLKFASESGVQAVRGILAEPSFSSERKRASEDCCYDVAIIGAGVAGLSAALEAKKAGLRYVLFEATESLQTLKNFPKGKPIFTYPPEMKVSGGVRYPKEGYTKESLLEEIVAQAEQVDVTEMQISHVKRKGKFISVVPVSDGKGGSEPILVLRCIIAIGKSGNYRPLGVSGEELDKVMNRLHDPNAYRGKEVVVIGGGDSAVESALALAEAGGLVTLSYRKPILSRPKPENVERLRALEREGRVALRLGGEVQEITEDAVILKDGERLENEVVFSMIGREAPLDFFRRSGVKISGERGWCWRGTAFLTFLFFSFLYQWKKGGTWLPIQEWCREQQFFPFGFQEQWVKFGVSFANPKTPWGTLQYCVGDPGFWYSLVYCIVIVVFGVRRVRRRNTPYVKRQTLSLACIQVIPLFLLPYLLLPWMGFNGAFESGAGKWLADEFFPVVNYGSGREYWRAFGLILAWPLFFWNVFTSQPMWGWLVLSVVQTFVIIPAIVYRWGKGAYCGWICSCGALAETLGDAHRHKMPHGRWWNKLNMIGQVFLGLALLLLLFRVLAWCQVPFFEDAFQTLLYGLPHSSVAQPWSYAWFVDLLFAGILGVAFYFHLSGRVWCRFACPLAALMHIYARFGKFRIFAEKEKCISCNVCTSVCHQGIDIMNFANKGAPMSDPQCVRCSACVQQCPTGVLQFGRLGVGGIPLLDEIVASPHHESREGDSNS